MVHRVEVIRRKMIQVANGTGQADSGKPQEDLVNNNSYVSLDAIPAYDGKAYVAVNNNEPFFYG